MAKSGTPVHDMLVALGAEIAAERLENHRLEAELEQAEERIAQLDVLLLSLSLSLAASQGNIGGWVDLEELRAEDVAQLVANMLSAVRYGLDSSGSPIRLAITHGPAPDGESYAVGAAAYDPALSEGRQAWLDEVLRQAVESSNAQRGGSEPE